MEGNIAKVEKINRCSNCKFELESRKHESKNKDKKPKDPVSTIAAQ